MHEEGCDRYRSNESYGHSLTELAVPACKSGEYNPPPSVRHMDGKRAASRKGRRVVFLGVCTCRAGPMCPAAGYAFFGGARGPRPTGRYVEPRVGDGVPSARRCRAARPPLGGGCRRSRLGEKNAWHLSLRQRFALTPPSQREARGDGFPRQCSHWLGMTGNGRTESFAPTRGYRRFPGGTSYPKGICSAARHGRTVSRRFLRGRTGTLTRQGRRTGRPDSGGRNPGGRRRGRRSPPARRTGTASRRRWDPPPPAR